MRVMAEWYATAGPDATAMHHQCVEFEGETREEIDAQIRARAGKADVQVVGLHNAIHDYAEYTGVPAEELAQEYPYGFADSPSKPASQGWFRRALSKLALGVGRP